MRFGGYGSFDEYFDKEEKVYVRNKTNPLGYVSVNIGDNRNPKFFTVLKTVIPICLTDYFVKDEIRRSTDLRQLVMKGVIELVSQEEYERTVTPEMAEKVNVAMMNYEAKVPEGVSGTGEGVEEEVKPAVVQLIRLNTLSDEEKKEMDRVMTDDEIIAELETIDLSSVDKSYIFTNSKGKVKKWITKLIGVESGVNLEMDESVSVDADSESVDSVDVGGVSRRKRKVRK